RVAIVGDALFPAIALHPRVAILATLYTSVPAVIVAYVLYYFGIPAGW
ncbi:MAG: putative manganese transporter, partial [Myxococcota bacterium]